MQSGSRQGVDPPSTAALNEAVPVSEQESPAVPPQGVRRKARRIPFSVAPGALWLAALYVAPLLVVIATSFATPDMVGRPIWGFTPDNYLLVFDPLYLPIVVRTFAYAAAATVLCLVIGFPTAYTIARFGGRFKTLLMLTVLIPWLTDYLVRIYSWVQLLGNEGVINGFLKDQGWVSSRGLSLVGNPYSLLLGLVYNFLPIMIIALYSSIERMDKRLLEAARDLYSGGAATFLHVILPACKPGVLAGCLLVFLLCLGDFATAQFLGGSQYMLGNLIRDQFATAGSLPVGAALTVTLLAVLLVVGLSVRAVLRWRSPAGAIR